MILQCIGPRQWRGSLSPLGRIMLAVVPIGGVAVAQAVVKALRGVLSLGGAASAVYYIACLPARVVRKGHLVKPEWTTR
jgi:hypothetical protein